VQVKTKASKAKKSKGSDDDDDDDGEESAAKVEVKLDAGCCETPAKTGKSDCCGGSCCTECAPAKSEGAKTQPDRKEPKKQIN
jgi:hypothetical protein